MSRLCPRCGSNLNDDDICTNCGSEIDIYKKIKLTSKLLYNQGLQMAKLRDLSGAISLLKRSLKLDKTNIDAHNLLGLIYFEIGEVVPALQQWVISKNIQEEDNIAEDYIEKIHNNQHKFDMINTAIKKYNQALRYIDQQSEDLAIIQLKKVISLYPNFVKAYCLLALCYIHEDNLEKAKKCLKKVLSIDKSNYVALKYYEEISHNTEEEKDNIYSNEKIENSYVAKKSPKKENKINPSMLQFGYVIFGVVIGLLVAMFLIVPGRVKSKTKEADTLREELITQKDEYDTLYDSLTSDKEKLETDLEAKNSSLLEYQAKDAEYDSLENLISAISLYLEDDNDAAAEKLYLVKADTLKNEATVELYNKIRNDIYPKLSKDAFDKGSKLYSKWKNNSKDQYLLDAITNFQIATKYISSNASYADDMLYYEARCHQLLGQTDEALSLFNKLLDNYPNSSFRKWTKNQIEIL